MVRNELVVEEHEHEEQYVPPGSPVIGFRFQGPKGQRLQPPRGARPAADAGPTSPLTLTNRFSALDQDYKSTETVTTEFVIKAASKLVNNRLFVGRMAPDTHEDTLRLHLRNIGVNPNDIVDVSRITSQIDYKCAAFCVTVASENAQDIVLRGRWPKGIVRHHYSGPKNKNHGAKNTDGSRHGGIRSAHQQKHTGSDKEHDDRSRALTPDRRNRGERRTHSNKHRSRGRREDDRSEQRRRREDDRSENRRNYDRQNRYNGYTEKSVY